MDPEVVAPIVQTLEVAKVMREFPGQIVLLSCAKSLAPVLFDVVVELDLDATIPMGKLLEMAVGLPSLARSREKITISERILKLTTIYLRYCHRVISSSNSS